MDFTALLTTVWTYLKLVLLLTARQFIFLFALLLILSFLMQLVNVRFLRQTNKLFGSRLYGWLFGWISIPVHELGHAIFAVIFGHKITRLVLFESKSRGGQGGYMQHKWEGGNLWHRVGNLFISLGPIILGSLVVWLLSRLLLGISFSSVEILDVEAGISSQLLSIPGFILSGMSNTVLILGSIFGHITWKTLLFLYLSFALGSNICLSEMDTRNLKPAIWVVLALMLGFNLLTAWLGDFSLGLLDHLETGLTAFYGIMIYVMLLNLVFLLVTYLLNRLLGR